MLGPFLWDVRRDDLPLPRCRPSRCLMRTKTAGTCQMKIRRATFRHRSMCVSKPPADERKGGAGFVLRSSEVMPAATPDLQRLSVSPDNGNRRWLRAVALDDVPDRVHRHAG